MKLRPLQIVGLAAILVFGGMLAVQLMQPKRDPFALPGAVKMNDALPPPAEYFTPPPPGAEHANPIEAGSQDAKDDLYCSGLIFAQHQTRPEDTLSPEAQKRRDAVIALAVSGTGKLKAEGVATDLTTGPIADAHSEKARADFAANAPRIPLEDCMARASAAPPAN